MNDTVAAVTPDPAKEPTEEPAEEPTEDTEEPAGQTSEESSVDGRRSRWDAHRVTRRSELIDAAIKAIVHSGADVGMEEIAAVARTSKPVIYRYFADKPELHRAVTERIIGNVMGTLTAVIAADPPPHELIHSSVDAYLALLEHHPELYLFVVAHPQVEDSSDFAHLVADLLAQQLASHLERGQLDPALAHPWGEAIVGFINSASLWWLDHREAMTRAQLADYLSALLWGGAAGVYQAVGQPADPRPGPGVFPRIT